LLSKTMLRALSFYHGAPMSPIFVRHASLTAKAISQLKTHTEKRCASSGHS